MQYTLQFVIMSYKRKYRKRFGHICLYSSSFFSFQTTDNLDIIQEIRTKTTFSFLVLSNFELILSKPLIELTNDE